MRKLIFVISALAAFVSCVKEIPSTNQDTIVDQTSQEEPVLVTITANAPIHSDPNASSNSNQQQSSHTRTQLGADGKSVMWSPEDVVKLCFEPIRGVHSGTTRYGYQVNFTNNGTQMSESAYFSGTWAPANFNKLSSYGVAVYPGNTTFSFNSDATLTDYVYPTTTISYTHPEVQEAIEGTFANNLNLSYSMVNSVDVRDNKAKVTFKNLCAIFCVNLPATEYNIKSIKFEVDNNSNDTYMAGKTNFQLTSTKLSEQTISGSGNPTYVVLEKADGSNLKAGEKYYAVVYPHGYKGVKLTFTNDQGKTCTKVASKDAWLMAEAGKKYTFNISSLNFSDAPFLNVDVKNITVDKKGGTSSFLASANNAVSVSSSVSWISASYSDGQCVLDIQPNKESNSRTATITLSSSGLTKTVEITQPYITYSISGSALTKASDLTNGQMYVVRRQASSNEYWNVNSSGTLVLATVGNTSSFTGNQVFIFNKDNSQAAGVSYGSGYYDKYSYMSAGAWQSVWNDQYLNHSFYLGSTKYYFSMYSGWKQNSISQKTGEDFDIYKANDSNMVNWTGSAFNWGNSGTDKYKWTFYLAVENQ